MDSLWLYRRFVIKYFKSKLEYKLPFAMDVLVNILNSLSFFAVIYFIIGKFNFLSNWELYEVTLMYSIGLFSFGIAGTLFWYPVTEMENLMISGQLDGYLIKPIHPLFHLVSKHFGHTFLGQIIVGISLLCYSFFNLDIDYNFTFWISFIVLVINAILVQCAIMISLSPLCFYFAKPQAFAMMVVVELQVMSRYPADIFHKIIQLVMIFGIPYMFVSYFPAYLLVNSDISKSYMLVNYIIGPILFGLSLLFFNKSLRRYNSAGS